MATLLELELDFSDHEDLEFANREELLQLAATADRHLTELCSSFRYGNAIKAGTPIAIIGEANAGKSTLLNALLREERAIVSNIPGTTRDTLEEQLVIEGRLFRIIDTAGIRETENPIEQIGIQRTLEKMEQADILLCVLDATCAMSQLQALRPYLQRCLSGKMPPQLVLVVNKMDLSPTPIDKDLFLQEVEQLFAEASQEYSPLRPLSPIDILPISALSSAGIGRLRQAISSHAATLPAEQTIITNERHYEALCKARQALQQAIEGLSLSLPTDLVSEDFKACIHHLSDIIGEISSSDILENIFKNFCIGK
jgi:tRNA modification GTPase